MGELSEETVEEIVKKQNAKEFERDVKRRSDKLAAGIGALVCCTLALVSLFVRKVFDYGVWAVFFSISGVMLVMDRKAADGTFQKVWRLVLGIVLLILAGISVFMYIGKAVGL